MSREQPAHAQVTGLHDESASYRAPSPRWWAPSQTPSPWPTAEPPVPSRPARVYPSRLPRDPVPTGYDGLPAARWRDPRIAAAYADRDDALERAVVWPELAEAVRPAQQRRGPGRPDGVV